MSGGANEPLGEPPARLDVQLPPHLPALDGLRGVAIFLVVAHMLGLLQAPTGPFGEAVSLFFATGWIGVQLFFVLSGFLITGILLDTRGAPNYLQAFFARRFLRIFPLYYGTLAVAFLILPALGVLPAPLAHDRPHQVWLWTYLSNWVLAHDARSETFPHFWSLAVEEQFYLVWPFVLRALDARRCLALCVALALAALAARVGLLAAGVSRDALYTFLFTRMDALALGGAAAAALRVPAASRWLVARRRALPAASLAVLVVGALSTDVYALPTFAGSTIGYLLLSVAFALAVLGAATAELTPPSRSLILRAAPLRTLGKYSYAIYVFHKPLHDFVGKPLLARLHIDATRSAGAAIVYVLAGLSAVLLAAFLSYHLYEKHFLRLKGRFVPRLARPIHLE
jgi:peptidoglycan/LPS O-acetylase OafA/YrhL